MKKITVIVMLIFSLIASNVHPESLILNNKYIHINALPAWPSLNEYLNSHKRFKNYRISDNTEKRDILLTIMIKKITFIVTDFNNDNGTVAIQEDGVSLQKKNEQTVKFNYEIELNIIYEKNSVQKKIVLNDSYNIWFTFKKISNDETAGMMENEIYINKEGAKETPEEINKSFNKVGMTSFKEQLLLDMSKKIANRLSIDL